MIDPRFTVHTHHAERERMVRWECSKAEKCAGDGDLVTLGEGDDLLFGAGLDDAVAREDEGLLRGLDELDGLLDGGAFGAQHGVRAVRGRRGGGEVEGGGGLLGVLGDVDEDGAGAAGFRDLEGETHGGRDVFGAGDEEVVLGDGQGDAGDVDFLEGVGAEDFGGDLPSDRYDGDAIKHGGGDAGDEVCRTGTGGGHADADLARGAGVAVGHVRGTLLVAHEDVVDGELAQGVVDGEDGSAGVAEDAVYVLAGEGGPEDFCSGEGGVLICAWSCLVSLLPFVSLRRGSSSTSAVCCVLNAACKSSVSVDNWSRVHGRQSQTIPKGRQSTSAKFEPCLACHSH